MGKTKFYYMFTVILWFTIAVTAQKGGRISTPVVYSIAKHWFLPKFSLEAVNKQDWGSIHKGQRNLKKKGLSWQQTWHMQNVFSTSIYCGH